MNIKILIILLGFAAFAVCSSEFFKVPDLSFISGNRYDVFENAPNRNKKYGTIQKAIDQALCDGFTPDSGKTAWIVIHPKDTPYTGDGPDNEIYVPFSITLSGSPQGSGFDSPKIEATLIFDDQDAAVSPELRDIIRSISNLNIAQPSPDKPAIYVNYENPAGILALDSCFLTSPFLQTTAPLILQENFAYLIGFKTLAFSISNQPIFLAKDISQVECYYCVISAAKVLRHEGIMNGAVIPTTYILFQACDIFSSTDFLQLPPPIESSIMFEITNPAIDVIVLVNNLITQLSSNSNFPFTVFKSYNGMSTLPENTPSQLAFISNTYALKPTVNHTDILYDSPTAPIFSRNFKTFSSSVETLSPGTILIDALSM